MSSVVLITGAATGIGNLTPRTLATAGHTVYASMRDIEGRNAARARALAELGPREGLDLRVVELDVQSEASAEAAAARILGETGQLDTVVHNAGHLYVGYVEAFTPEDVKRLFDINILGIQRVNRAVLPHMRERRSGTLLYVGSTTTVVVPPFMGPYVASKFAADTLAQVTAYELNPFGIETTILMPALSPAAPSISPMPATPATSSAAGRTRTWIRWWHAMKRLRPPSSPPVSTPTLRASPKRSPASSPCPRAPGPSAALSTSATPASRTSARPRSRPRPPSAAGARSPSAASRS